jgi:hypothetical protein
MRHLRFPGNIKPMCTVDADGRKLFTMKVYYLMTAGFESETVENRGGNHAKQSKMGGLK